jgi:hypothetical protein
MAMAMAMAMAAAEAMERRLRSDGWHVKDGAIAEILEQLRDDAAAPSPPSRHSADPSYEALVAELLDSDLKTIGLPCLPDPSAIQHLSKFQGPLILQVGLVRLLANDFLKLLCVAYGRLSFCSGSAALSAAVKISFCFKSIYIYLSFMIAVPSFIDHLRLCVSTVKSLSLSLSLSIYV